MKNIGTTQFLWILCGLMVVSLVTVAVIDQVSHPVQRTVGAPTAGITPDSSPVKIGTRIGFTAPDFTLPTTDNREFKLSDHRGKPVILNFWASWCGPCRYEVPAFKSFYEKYGNEGVSFIAVNTQDNPESALAYAKSDGLKFTIPVDPRGQVSSLYNVRGLPTTYFIDKDGIITSIKIGPFLFMEEIEERMGSFK
jgi:thiol-disulfide isomerase/thioredoxin